MTQTLLSLTMAECLPCRHPHHHLHHRQDNLPDPRGLPVQKYGLFQEKTTFFNTRVLSLSKGHPPHPNIQIGYFWEVRLYGAEIYYICPKFSMINF